MFPNIFTPLVYFDFLDISLKSLAPRMNRVKEVSGASIRPANRSLLINDTKRDANAAANAFAAHLMECHDRHQSRPVMLRTQLIQQIIRLFCMI